MSDGAISTHYKCKHFAIEEFVDKATYQQMGNRCWSLIDCRLLYTADGLREFFGVPVYLNNWKWGGDKQWRGLRNPKSPDYSPTSQHTFGRAVDAHVRGVTAEEARQAILKHKDDPRFRFITRLENGVSWLHLDLANVADRIVLFNP